MVVHLASLLSTLNVYGSYYCTDCNVIFHVKCVMKYSGWYCVVSPENEDEKPLDVNSITNILERNDTGEATLIEHFKHNHYLTLSDKSREFDDKCCDGCMLLVLDPFYYCSRYDIFECERCDWVSNGFAYRCNECGSRMCLRCATLTPDSLTCPGHQHPLLFYIDEEGKCSACGENSEPIYCCKDCKYSVDLRCIRLPERVRHKCDDHLLALTYHEVNDYSKHHCCDICERKTDPELWFYHCATCDTSAHVNCVLGKYPFIKTWRDHPHPLTFVRKINSYPECTQCGKPCEGLALECAEPECNYIVHWQCINPDGSDSSLSSGDDSDE
ncbi:uncharacterized protein LOC120218587 [Hibiscus syriacus]|uniref:uncharacterized protein LOC120218587 n=1 Tax=Hibiscus syriacus TaxID=106335 RepID=UPI001921641C|nr:uncharacterized protein LOC120218587 [Hibiscus syriacus]